MTIFRILVIFFLVAAILGGSVYYSYELFWKPAMPVPVEENVERPPPPPDPSVVAYDRARALGKTGDWMGERDALRAFLGEYPAGPKAEEAAEILGSINASRFFSPDSSSTDTLYKVVKGDSLVRIASKHKTNAELIYRVNNLETINLRIGQELFIPKVDTSLLVDTKAGTVTLFDGGEFFKKYKVVSMKTGRAPGKGTTKVVDKLALKGSERVAFGGKNYAGCDRWIMLGRAGLVIRGMPEDAAAAPPAGILMSPSDIEEIFLLVSRGVPVTIQ
jgi:LysM repeat protein